MSPPRESGGVWHHRGMRWSAASVLILVVVSCGDAGGGASSESSASEDTQGVASSTSADSDTSDASGTASPSTTGPVPTGDADLVALDGFGLVDAAADPFADRPSDDTCTLGFGLEDGLFEVDAELCLYGAFSAPSLADVRAGDLIEAVIVHDALFSEEPGAESHLGVAIGDEVGWETTIPIPADAGFLRPTWTATADAPAGTPIHFHIHNHGVNTYRLVAITVTYP